MSDPIEHAAIRRAHAALDPVLRHLKRRAGLLTDAEVERYSLTGAIQRATAERFHRDGSLELDVHKALCAELGETPSAGCIRIPPEVLERDLTAGGAGSAGGYLVDANRIPSFYAALVARSMVFRMGATRLPGLRGNCSVAGLTTGSTTNWLTNEATAATEQTPVLGSAAISPHTAASYMEISRQLMKQTTPAAEALLMADIATAVAVAVDAAAIQGTGASGQPLGIIGTAGVGTTTGSTLGHAGIIAAEYAIANSNGLVNPDSAGILTTPAIAQTLAGRQRFTGSDSPVWQGSISDGIAGGLRAASTKNVPSGDLIVADWSQLVIAEWSDLMVEVNPYANFTAGIIGVRAMWTCDIALRHATSFYVITSVT